MPTRLQLCSACPDRGRESGGMWWAGGWLGPVRSNGSDPKRPICDVASRSSGGTPEGRATHAQWNGACPAELLSSMWLGVVVVGGVRGGVHVGGPARWPQAQQVAFDWQCCWLLRSITGKHKQHQFECPDLPIKPAVGTFLAQWGRWSEQDAVVFLARCLCCTSMCCQPAVTAGSTRRKACHAGA